MASSNRRGRDRGKSLLNNRAETLQLPRGNIGMITPCVQWCINELYATRVCFAERTDINPMIKCLILNIFSYSLNIQIKRCD